MITYFQCVLIACNYGNLISLLAFLGDMWQEAMTYLRVQALLTEAWPHETEMML